MRRPVHSEPSGVVLRRESGQPIYLQVVDQLRFLIGAGRFRVGDYLPPMRQVADELGLNLNTVLRVYSELQRDGLIQSTRGKGAVVVRADSASSKAFLGTHGSEPGTVDAMIGAAVEHALSVGLEPADIIARTRAALDSVGERAPSGPSIAVMATPEWRARILAEGLRSMGIRRVRAITDAAGSIGADLVVRPMFGVSDPSATSVGAPTLNVSLLLDRATVRQILEIEPRSSVAVIAGDESGATWLADAVAGYAGIRDVRRVVALSLADVELSGLTVAVIERGMPRGATAPSSLAVVDAGIGFPASIAELIENRVDTSGGSRSA